VIFSSPEFVVFGALFFLAWAVVSPRWRRQLLLAGSYLFYASWDWRFLTLLVGSTLLDFLAARRIAASDELGVRRRWLLLSLGFNLGALAFFKYFDFFVQSLADLLSALGLEARPDLLAVVLPMGISFYTFQTMSYTIDVYRGRETPTDSLLDFAVYVCFFPQLVAGPIERSRNLLPQVRRLAEAGAARADWSGLGFLALGAFKKVVLADNFAVLVDATYADPSSTFGAALWVGTLAFAMQIYFDFSGYSDMAIGLGRLLGIDLMENFRSPYAAVNPSDFWQRWHISLSSWLRDYLYIPLGGNRQSPGRTMRNLALTMLLGGLWHGAAWNFVLWGAFHGGLLMAFRARAVVAAEAALDDVPGAKLVRRLLFFLLVCLGWALFRAESMADCAVLAKKLLNPFAWESAAFVQRVVAAGEVQHLTVLGVVALLAVVVQHAWPRGTKSVVAALWRLPVPVRYLICGALFYAAMVAAPERPPPFIYFQF
jgi:D-alanyl-lipoteichoic acid acyltransferase DltB (MBOAT superfamily)